MIALLFAAGRGERLRPLTDQIAKPAIPFLNFPMLGFPLFYLEQAGLKTLLVNTHHLPQTVESAVKRMVRWRTKVLFSREDGTILGSGGGLARAAKLVPDAEDLVLANADAVCLFEDRQIIQKLIETHKNSKALATLLLSPFPQGAKQALGGVYVDQAGLVQKFSKTKISDPKLKSWHFTGYIVVNRSVFSGLSEEPSNLLYDILQKRIDQGELVSSLVDTKARFFETGNSQDYLTSTEECLKLLTEPSSLQKSLISILDRFTPNWWKGWRGSGPLILGSLPWPEELLVSDFAVFSSDALFPEKIHLERSVVTAQAQLEPGTHLKDKLV